MANMTQCQQGHFYDSGKHSTCPWCGVGGDVGAGGGGAGKTTPMQSADAPPPPPPPPTSPPAPAGGGAGATRRIGSGPGGGTAPPPGGGTAGVTRRISPSAAAETEAGFDPVVGWLVCVEGQDRGRDYRLRTAKNFIGRAANMDVCLAGDDTVSRERHAVVVFEPEEKKFYLLSGDSQGLVYLNGKVVHVPAELNGDDVIKVGKTKLMFVPFCGERHQWE